MPTNHEDTIQSPLPVFYVIREDKLHNLLSKWLSTPELDEVVLVSFSFDPRYHRSDATLARKLELLASYTDVTLITALPEGSERERIRAAKHRQLFRNLVISGVRVLIHDALHAKVYLFKRGARVCWVVGSSNLTYGGLSENTEVNVTGYRQVEFLQVASQVDKIKNEAYAV